MNFWFSFSVRFLTENCNTLSHIYKSSVGAPGRHTAPAGGSPIASYQQLSHIVCEFSVFRLHSASDGTFRELQAGLLILSRIKSNKLACNMVL